MPQSGSHPGERQPLLADDDVPCDHPSDQPCAPNPHAKLPVYETIHRIRVEVINSLEDPYSLDQLRAPRINVSVVRPLVNRIWDRRDVSIIYCLLVNKLQFLREQHSQAHTSMAMTRAMLCELVATKILRRFDEDHQGIDGLLLLANVMVAGFWPFQQAPRKVIEQSGYAAEWASHGPASYERTSTALEIAIISNSKMVISCTACQKVMEAIHVGRVVYTPVAFIDILPDHYKHKPIALYRPEKAPLLNQYRLMVPRTRNLIDVGQFLILLILYIITLQHRNYEKFTVYEGFFCVYALGWVLDEFASILEHGWHCYTQNLWSFLDTIFAVIYLVYFILRMHSLAAGGGSKSAAAALDILSAAAPVLIPRLAFNLMSENMLIVSLRAMMADFIVLTFLAIWCFAGFFLSLAWLSGDNQDSITISKWMLFVWFGLDGVGIQESASFHWLIGPLLMIFFAFLGNTLFLTILVSMLSSTFANISSNAGAEIQFRRAVVTFEGVKRDSIFAYQPPFNLLALCFMLPLKLLVSARWFHKVNVAVIRTLNFPLLLAISFYERRNLWRETKDGTSPLLRRIVATRNSISEDATWLAPLTKLWDLSRFSVHGDTQAVFAFETPDTVQNETAEDFEEAITDGQTQTLQDPLITFSKDTAKTGSRVSLGGSPLPSPAAASRKDGRGSAADIAGFSAHLMGDSPLDSPLHTGRSSRAKMQDDLEERMAKLERISKRMERTLQKIEDNFPQDDDEDGDGHEG